MRIFRLHRAHSNTHTPACTHTMFSLSAGMQWWRLKRYLHRFLLPLSKGHSTEWISRTWAKGHLDDANREWSHYAPFITALHLKGQSTRLLLLIWRSSREADHAWKTHYVSYWCVPPTFSSQSTLLFHYHSERQQYVQQKLIFWPSFCILLMSYIISLCLSSKCHVFQVSSHLVINVPANPNCSVT